MLQRFIPSSIVALCLVASVTAIAIALPATEPDDTFMTNGRVRAVTPSGGQLWIGGAFDQLEDSDATPARAVTGLAALLPDGRESPVTAALPAFTGSGIEVWDMSEWGGVLFVTGRFTYQHDGELYRNTVGIDPLTGSIVRPFRTIVGRAILATQDAVFVGEPRLMSYRPSGGRSSGFTAVVPWVDPVLRRERIIRFFRDIDESPDGSLVAVGHFDEVNDRPAKVAVKIDRVSGQVHDWRPGRLPDSSGAIGISATVQGSVVYIASGGPGDFTAAYDLETGDRLWHTSTSGSSQAIEVYDEATLVVGGHFQWIEDADTPRCGSNQNPDTGCVHQPRLAALDIATGAVDEFWRPSVQGRYKGVWGLLVDGGQLHVGGEFTRVGGEVQRFYARLPELP